MSVVKNVVAEEDRSRNLLIFGLTEESGEHKESGEQISKKVENVLDLGRNQCLTPTGYDSKLSQLSLQN